MRYVKLKMFTLLILACLIIASCTKDSTKEHITSEQPRVSEQSLTTRKPKINEINTAKSLEKTDFEVTFNNFNVFIGLTTKDLIDKLGQGTADESNNFGFVGNDSDHKFKYYMRGYPKENPVIRVYTVVDIVTADSQVSQIDLLNYKTNRGAKVGDSIDYVKQLYGEVNLDNDEAKYSFSDKTIVFRTDSKGIIQNIQIIRNK